MVRELRRQRGLSIRELEERSSVSYNTIWRLENGLTGAQPRTIRRLAAFSAALIIAFQLTVNFWFYTYIIWFEPFVFLALFPATNEKTILDREQLPTASDRQEINRSQKA